MLRLLPALFLVVACGPPPDRCLPADGEPRDPQTIAEVVDLMNDLPQPVTPACLVESLERPLRVEATDSFLSAQPAAGARSPRLFLTTGDVVLSVVPDGDGAELLEFGEKTTHGRSIKGELDMPAWGPIPQSAPFDKVAAEDGGTACALCHGEEATWDATLGAHDSVAVRPTDDSLVDLAILRDLAEVCDPLSEPERCAMLSALFDHGEVVHAPFPADYPTLYGP